MLIVNKKSTLLFWVLFLGSLTGFYSCMSPKKITYFQPSNTTADSVVTGAKPYVPVIRPGDVLNIQVSSLNPEASTFFNPYVQMASYAPSPNAQVATNQMGQTTGYHVDEDGKISFPMLGQLEVTNFTPSQLQKYLAMRLKNYLKEPTINVRLLSFRVSVLGEVAHPALFTIPSEQVTLTEALSMAGDITIFGQRNDVMVIREENGQKSFAHLDLTKRNWMTSPYYYLHPNDVVYIKPGKARTSTADRTFQLIPAALSALSLISIIIRYH